VDYAQFTTTKAPPLPLSLFAFSDLLGGKPLLDLIRDLEATGANEHSLKLRKLLPFDSRFYFCHAPDRRAIEILYLKLALIIQCLRAVRDSVVNFDILCDLNNTRFTVDLKPPTLHGVTPLYWNFQLQTSRESTSQTTLAKEMMNLGKLITIVLLCNAQQGITHMKQTLQSAAIRLSKSVLPLQDLTRLYELPELQFHHIQHKPHRLIATPYVAWQSVLDIIFKMHTHINGFSYVTHRNDNNYAALDDCISDLTHVMTEAKFAMTEPLDSDLQIDELIQELRHA